MVLLYILYLSFCVCSVARKADLVYVVLSFLKISFNFCTVIANRLNMCFISDRCALLFPGNYNEYRKLK